MKPDIKGTLMSLEIGESIIVPRNAAKVASVRSVATTLKRDIGRTFDVSEKGRDTDCTVIRTA